MKVDDELKHIPISLIVVNPYQPRKEFREEDLEELAQSIRTVGLLHPPLVRPLPHVQKYELISGERRLRAAQRASLTVIPVYVRKSTDVTSAHATLIENIQRVDLNPLEIAKALKSLINEFGHTQDQLAQKIGKKRSTLANYLRLLTLPVVIQDHVASGQITMGHAKALHAIEEIDKQICLLERILQENLSVRDVEQLVTKMRNKGKKSMRKTLSRDDNLEYLEGQLRERLGTQVSIQANGSKGKITIDYYHLDDLDRVLGILGININD